MIPVKVIRREGYSALVEWLHRGEKLRRGYVPADVVHDDQVHARELKAAIPYGEPWEEVSLVATSVALAENLRRIGIWTKADLRNHPNEAIGAIMATYQVDYHTLLKLTTGGNHE